MDSKDIESKNGAAQGGSVTNSKSSRAPACVRCSRRKIKCDRSFPCANCVRFNATCLPASSLGPRQRRRRFPERELLDRVRHYEELLRQNRIDFKPMHEPRGDEKPGGRFDDDAEDDDQDDDLHTGTSAASPNSSSAGEPLRKTRNLIHAINQRFPNFDDDSGESSDDDIRQSVVKRAWKHAPLNHELLLFGGALESIDLAPLHPDQVTIFKLWQIYLDNVNPVLHVTHTPSLQPRIIDAAGNASNMDRSLEALMFSIYCIAIMSLTDEQCQTMFESQRSYLLTRYQVGCQQALVQAGYLRTEERDTLTAFYLYLHTTRSSSDPKALSSTVAQAIRIAMRMNLHDETRTTKVSALESEMRRRLWWSLVTFDSRICEMAMSSGTSLDPTWSCKIPSNLNDSDLSGHVRESPAPQDRPTEAVFAVVRCEVSDFLRHSSGHLNFVNPALNHLPKDNSRTNFPAGTSLEVFESTLEERYLSRCNEEMPIQFMTIWLTRGLMAKNRTLHYYAHRPQQSTSRSDEELDTTVSWALQALQCDTMLMRSPLTKGYAWFLEMYFPFPAYIQAVQDLKRRPVSSLAEHIWQTLSDNFEVRCVAYEAQMHNMFFMIMFGSTIMQTWNLRVAKLAEIGQTATPPLIVRHVEDYQQRQQETTGQPFVQFEKAQKSVDTNNFFNMPMNYGGVDIAFDSPDSQQDLFVQQLFQDQPALDIDVSQINWAAMNWNTGIDSGWPA